MSHRRHHRASRGPARRQTRGALNRGRYDFCAGEYQLRGDGGVRVHTTGCHVLCGDGRWRPRYCPGSALPPRETSATADVRRDRGEPTHDHQHDQER